MELKNEFKPVSKQDWEAKLKAELKTKSLEDISWEISPDLRMDPVQFKEDLVKIQLPFSSNDSNDWLISADFKAKSLIKSNKPLIKSLLLGLQAPTITFLKTPKQAEWKNIFMDVHLNFIESHFVLGKEVKVNTFIKSFHKFLIKVGANPKKIKGSIDCMQEPKNYNPALDMVCELLPKFKLIGISLEHKKDEINNLAIALSKLEEIIYKAKTIGISPSKVRKVLFFKSELSDNFFMNTAKIRAIKILAQNVFEAYGIRSEYDYPVYASTSKKSYGDDQHQNMIRSSIQAIAGINGGIKRLNISSTKKGAHSKFTARVARNLSHLLKMESQMHLVNDPVAGSYFMDNLCNEVIEAAWQKFIEKTEKGSKT